MANEGMFVGAIQPTGVLAGVFEYDGETGYFYEYDQSRGEGQRILGAIHVLSGRPDFAESDVEVRWTKDGEGVGLFIRGRLWAAFRGAEKFGGNYRVDGQPNVPKSLATAFE